MIIDVIKSQIDVMIAMGRLNRPKLNWPGTKVCLAAVHRKKNRYEIRYLKAECSDGNHISESSR